MGEQGNDVHLTWLSRQSMPDTDSSGAEECIWLDAEPQLFNTGDVDYVHFPERMSQLSIFSAIMGGVQLDLMG